MVSVWTNIFLQSFYLGQTIVGEVKLFQLRQRLESFNLGQSIACR